MRILHTSDWHIGRQFHHVSLLDDQRYVLDQIVSIAASQKVDVVLIAGDIYDRAIPPASAVSLVDQTLEQLCNKLNIPVIIIAGNHDSPERLAFASRLLAQGNLYITGLLGKKIKPVVLQDEYGDVNFYPIPYVDPASVRTVFCDVEAEDLRTHDQCLSKIIQQIPQHKKQRSVALSHCFLAGGDSCESERPLSVGGADQVSSKYFRNFSYAALGHLHSQQQRGTETIRYAGSILKYSFSEEQHQKSVTLVDMDAQGHCQIEHMALKARRDMRSIRGIFDEIISAAQNDPDCDDYILISLDDTHAILDPMGKLRAVYPNVLHLERPGLMSENKQRLAHRDLLKKGELSLFKDFYQQVQDETLSDAQEKIVSRLLDEIHHADDSIDSCVDQHVDANVKQNKEV